MSEQDRTRIERRHALKMLGGAVVAVPLATLVSACSSDEPPPPAAEAPAEPPPEPESPAPTPEQPPQPAPAAELTPLAEDDPQAVNLGYVDDASTVDAGQYPRYQAGQLCSNCALYLGGDAAQGGCPLFPGKSVKAAGWCSAYAPMG